MNPVADKSERAEQDRDTLPHTPPAGDRQRHETRPDQDRDACRDSGGSRARDRAAQRPQQGRRPEDCGRTIAQQPARHVQDDRTAGRTPRGRRPHEPPREASADAVGDQNQRGAAQRRQPVLRAFAERQQEERHRHRDAGRVGRDDRVALGRTVAERRERPFRVGPWDRRDDRLVDPDLSIAPELRLADVPVDVRSAGRLGPEHQSNPQDDGGGQQPRRDEDSADPELDPFCGRLQDPRLYRFQFVHHEGVVPGAHAGAHRGMRAAAVSGRAGAAARDGRSRRDPPVEEVHVRWIRLQQVGATVPRGRWPSRQLRPARSLRPRGPDRPRRGAARRAPIGIHETASAPSSVL